LYIAMTPRLKGFLLAALSLILLCAAALGIPAAIAGDTHAPLWAVLGAYIALVIAPIAVFVLGVPAHLTLQLAGKRSLRAYVWTGFGISAGLALLGSVTLPESSARGLIQTFEILIVLIAGPLSAAVFWCVARPDRAILPKQAPPA
jgi:hypothetical protein